MSIIIGLIDLPSLFSQGSDGIAERALDSPGDISSSLLQETLIYPEIASARTTEPDDVYWRMWIPGNEVGLMDDEGIGGMKLRTFTLMFR